jgi:hypothetical protein
MNDPRRSIARARRDTFTANPILVLAVLLSVAGRAWAQGATTAGYSGKPDPASSSAGRELAAAPKMLALPPLPADAAPLPAHPLDFEGIWLAEPMSGAPGGLVHGKLTPKALKEQQYRIEMNAKGRPIATNAARCRPMNDIGVGADLYSCRNHPDIERGRRIAGQRAADAGRSI